MPTLTEDNRIDAAACTDCALWIVNNDDSGATDEWDRETVEATLEQFTVFIGDEIGFSHSPCDICASEYSGDRHQADMWENKR